MLKDYVLNLILVLQLPHIAGKWNFYFLKQKNEADIRINYQGLIRKKT